MKILRTASVGSKFTGSYKKLCVPILSNIREPSNLLRNLPPIKQITKTLQYYKLTDYQVHILLRLQGTSIH